MKRAAALALGPLVLLLVPFVSAQTPETQSSAGLWDVLVAPSMDPEKSAVAENVDKYKLVATGQKASESLDGKELVTTWKSEVPLAFAGFAFGDYKVFADRLGDIEVQVFAKNQPDDLLQAIQQHFDNSANDLATGPDGSRMSNTMSAVGNLNAAALGKTITVETENTLKVFQNYFGTYPYHQIAVTNIRNFPACCTCNSAKI